MRQATIKRIWGLAKGEQLSDDELYEILYRETGKEHMRECSDRELERVLAAVIAIKDTNAWRPGMATKRQLWKIRQLELALGWDENPKRLAAFVKKYYQVEDVQWLSTGAASNLIDSLKNLLAKERGQNGA